MRLRVAVVTAVLLGSVAAGAGVAALPAGAGVAALPTGVGVAAQPAGATVKATSEPSVTVKAIDREGKAVAVTAVLESAPFPGNWVTLTSAHATKVAKGTYNIAAFVYEPGKKAATLVDRAVTIASSTTVTLDARPGKRVRFTVNDGAVAQDGVFAEPYSTATGVWAWENNAVGAPNPGTPLYLVPGALPSGWDLIVQGDLVRHETNHAASPVEYDLVKTLSGSVPSNLTFAYNRAGLALEHVTVRDFGQGTDGLGFDPNDYVGIGGLDYLVPTMQFGQLDFRTPATIDVYLSPGYPWESADFAAGDDVRSAAPLAAGHTYSQTFGAAVFSPSPLLGPVVYGSSLGITETFGNDLLVDAGPNPVYSMSTGQYPLNQQGWLYAGSKLIKHVTAYGATFTAKIPTTMQAYTLKFEASRANLSGIPLGGLAKSVTATYTFTTKAGDNTLSASDFWPRIVPQGLSLKNAAADGSKTAVPITFDTVHGPIAAHDVAVWASLNGGKTWVPLAVRHSGSTWTVAVVNPKQAGYVSLRVRGENAAGFKATVTVTNAYAVS